MQYRPNPDTECCSGNVHRIMPNYLARMWMQADADTVVAVLYGPSTFKTHIGDQTITIEQETTFPFEDRVRLKIPATRPAPGVCVCAFQAGPKAPPLLINGTESGIACPAGTFIECRRAFSDGDVLELHLPMQAKLTRWPEGGIALERGPLVYSLAIESETTVDPIDGRSCEGLPPKTMVPADTVGGTWNYGMDLTENELDSLEFKTVQAVGATPWSPEHAPVAVSVPVRKIVRWEFLHEEYTVVGCQWHNNRHYRRGPFTLYPIIAAS